MKHWIIILGLFLICTGSTLTASADGRPLTRLNTTGPFWASSGQAAGRQPLINYHFPSSILYPPISTFRASSFLASSADGAKLYEFWCSTCHGDRGQGLTAEWRAQWPEGKQNCWQAKCHAGSHPPDGFSFPKNVPALIGPDTLAKFATAQDLYVYSRAAMPYWSPNLLTDDEYQAITIFLVKANYAARDLPVPAGLSQNLNAVYLSPDLQMGGNSKPQIETSGKVEQLPSKTITSAAPPTSDPKLAASGYLTLLWISLIVLGGVSTILLTRRFSSRSQ